MVAPRKVCREARGPAARFEKIGATVRMSTTITQIACDLNEKVENRYALVLEIAELAKRLLEDNRDKGMHDPFAKVSTSSDKVIYQALIMKSSEIDIGDGLIG